jgi:glutamyl-Q tRNA(Asp) synthetase
MIVTRFAPSPTGYLHLGHALAAIIAHDAAQNGQFRLRIEDLDLARARNKYAGAILEDLRWLGLAWDGRVVRQSRRFDGYRNAVSRLDAQGLLYPCFCTRAEIASEIARATEAPHGPDGPLYPGTCRSLPSHRRKALMDSGRPYALRLDSRRAAQRLPSLCFEEALDEHSREYRCVAVDPLRFGDVVLARKDVPAAYHLAVVVDDAEQGVTLVTRGSDLLPATHIQRVLQSLLELPVPRYAHHRLVLNESGRKFSKRDSAATLRDLRANGVSPGLIRARLFATPAF